MTASAVPAARIVRMPGGRALAFSEFGDPAGFPVINCHGGLLGRLDVMTADRVARALGIWLLSPDRPGIGDSEPAAGRLLLDWPDDVARLVDLLGIDRFGVMGWSMGGQYAAACAHRLGDRITRAAIIGGCPPLDDPGTFAELNRMDTTFIRLARRAPWADRGIFAAMALLATRAPRLWTELTARGLSDADASVVRDLGEAFPLACASALRCTEGLVTEYLVFGEPWGFRPEDVEIGVDVWQGEHDNLVPPRWADELARRIPDSERHVVAEAGHFLAHDHYAGILTRLLPVTGRR